MRGAGCLPANPQLSRPARQAIDRHIHFAVGRASAHIRLSLRINISLTIGEIYKMVEDFSTQFNSLYLLMKYLAIISRHPVYICMCVCGGGVYIYTHVRSSLYLKISQFNPLIQIKFKKMEARNTHE